MLSYSLKCVTTQASHEMETPNNNNPSVEEQSEQVDDSLREDSLGHSFAEIGMQVGNGTVNRPTRTRKHVVDTAMMQDLGVELGASPNELGILVTVEDQLGEALPPGDYNEGIMATLLQGMTGDMPAQVEKLGPKDMLVVLQERAHCVTTAMALQRITKLGLQVVRVRTLIANPQKLYTIAADRNRHEDEREQLLRRAQRAELQHQEESARWQQAFREEQLRAKLLKESQTITSREPSREEVVKGSSDVGKCKPPKIGCFSGDDPVPKHEIAFDEWLFLIKDAQQRYSDEVVREAMLHSLRGNASRTVRHLGHSPTVDQVLSKLTRVYASKSSTDSLMQSFYRLKQGEGEKVQAFAMRLETAREELRQRDPDIKFDEGLNPLRARFFFGLHKSLRDSLRYLYDKFGADYEELLSAARTAEDEQKMNSPPSRGRSKQVKAKEEDVESIKAEMEELKASLKNLNKKPNKPRPQSRSTSRAAPNGPPIPRSSSESKGDTKEEEEKERPDPSTKDWRLKQQCFKCGGWGHFVRNCPSRLNYQRGGAPNQPTPPADQ